MTAFLDANVRVPHLTGDPPEQAERATRYLREAEELLLPDLVLDEVVCALESFIETPQAQVGATLRAVLAYLAIRVIDADLLQRAIDHEPEPMDVGIGPRSVSDPPPRGPDRRTAEACGPRWHADPRDR